MRLLAAVLAAMLVAAASTARAERADRDKPVNIESDRMTADDAKQVAVFDGRVVLTQGTFLLRADKLTVRQDKDGFSFAVAEGKPATFRQKRDNVDEWVEGYAARAEFDDLADVLKLYDRARVKSNQNEITGDFISYDMRRELAAVRGAPPGQTPPADKRVKVIILPAKKEPGKDEKGAAAPKAPPPLTLKPDTGGAR